LVFLWSSLRRILVLQEELSAFHSTFHSPSIHFSWGCCLDQRCFLLSPHFIESSFVAVFFWG
jgi:hypothetical protein